MILFDFRLVLLTLESLYPKSMNYQLKFIKYGSNEYYQAIQLRYRLFYQEHNIPWKSVLNSQEKQDLHAAIINAETDCVLAYGLLSQNSCDEFQIYQMVVEPEFQRQGLGRQILNTLINSAIKQDAKLLILNARVTKTEFYQKFGFEPIGEVFLSLITGVPHIRMQKQLLC